MPAGGDAPVPRPIWDEDAQVDITAGIISDCFPFADQMTTAHCAGNIVEALERRRRELEQPVPPSVAPCIKEISPMVGVTIPGEDFDVLFTMFERLTSPYSTINELAEIIRFENQIRRWLEAIKTGKVGVSLSGGPARSEGEL